MASNDNPMCWKTRFVAAGIENAARFGIALSRVGTKIQYLERIFGKKLEILLPINFPPMANVIDNDAFMEFVYIKQQSVVADA